MKQKKYNGVYEGDRSSYIAFPLGGIGAGMFCLEGTGAMSHFAMHHRPDNLNEPIVFSAVSVKGKDGVTARVLEGPIPKRKIFGSRMKDLSPGTGLFGRHYGLPRFANSAFRARFPFGSVELSDAKVPVTAKVTGWSPFVPLNADDSSLPVAGLEYTFENVSDDVIEIVYSYHAVNFMASERSNNHQVLLRIMLAWYVPESNLNAGVPDAAPQGNPTQPAPPLYHKPWYAGRFKDISETSSYWHRHYSQLREETEVFTDSFYSTTIPNAMLEAIAANLSILKSPTVHRQIDGRFWGWEGIEDQRGSCHGTCTHVWNYAQALPHLFPYLERTIRETEFNEGQDDQGHQNFRVPLPIQPADHDFHAAADGQLGGIMKIYREWRISGDTEWLLKLWPKVKQSLQYCIETWDPDKTGVLSEPHHNTYDIEFWGPDGMCSSIYLGALKAAARIAEVFGDSSDEYNEIYERGRHYLENELFNGEYFEQKIIWEGLRAPSPIHAKEAWNVNYSAEAMALLQEEGPKYDAVERTLYVSPRVAGDYSSFLSTASGYGIVGMKDGVPFVDVRAGQIEIDNIKIG